MRQGALLAALLSLVVVEAASAHDATQSEGYVSSVTTIEPAILGLQSDVLGAQQKLLVRNWTTKRVVVYAQHGEALVLPRGQSQAWHDHRIGWFLPTPPDIVRRQPDRPHYIRAWQVRGRAGGRPFVIRGLLGYQPSLQSEPEGRGWILPAALAAAVSALAAGVGARRARRRAP